MEKIPTLETWGARVGIAAAAACEAEYRTLYYRAPHHCQSIQKSFTKCLEGFRIPRAEKGEQWHWLGFASPVCPLVLLQLCFPAYSQLQLLADHLDLLLQLGEFLHHRVPSDIEGVCFPVGGQWGRELSSPWRKRDVLVGLGTHLVLSFLVTKDVFPLVVMTQIRSIPHHELLGSHVWPRKQRQFRVSFCPASPSSPSPMWTTEN